MKPEIENLKALVYGHVVMTRFQKSLAIVEWHNLLAYVKHLEYNSSEKPDSSK